jgi:hypothetical protein
MLVCCLVAVEITGAGEFDPILAGITSGAVSLAFISLTLFATAKYIASYNVPQTDPTSEDSGIKTAGNLKYIEATEISEVMTAKNRVNISVNDT